MNVSRKRRVEIYFVLYVVALVLLLPEPQNTEQHTVVTVPTDLSLILQPERVRLECSLLRDSAGGLRVRALDSVNIIRYNSGLDEVQIQARIEDVVTGHTLVIDPASTTSPMFELIPQTHRSAVLFRWHPDVTDGTPRTLRVTITGTAAPPGIRGPNSADADNLPAGLRLSGTTQFVLSTVVADDVPATYRPAAAVVDTLRIVQSTGRTSLGSFWMEAARDVITIPSQQQWTMRVSIGGADPVRDLESLPQVRASNGADVERYLDSAARTVIVRGRAPRNGSYTVTVSGKRRDGQYAQTQFVVQTLTLAPVRVADQMYPGIEYTIDTKLTDQPNALAVILDGQREVARSEMGTLRFSPKHSDTGKTFLFVRLVEGERAETPQTIRISSFPPPEIRDVKDYGSGDKKKVIVKFYGDRNRDRPTLVVLDGNVRMPKKLFGNLHQADMSEVPPISWIEEFEISRRDNAQPFSFTIQARDAKGAVSAIWKEGDRDR